jgi:type IV fimbrial biogenesis protein FimT
MLAHRQQGVTLLELMITLIILALALALGIPSFTEWMQNTQNRAAAESVLNGLQLARTEAVRRNTIVRFSLTDNAGRVAWTVGCVNVTPECPANIHSRPAEEGGSLSRVQVSTSPIPLPTAPGYFDAALGPSEDPLSGVSFNGLGRVPEANAGTDITRADVSIPEQPDGRRYVVIVGAGGQLRMCDPKLAFASNPQGCS